MPAPGERFFHFRPMFALAAGFVAGVAFSSVLSGAWRYIATCLFILFFLSALRFKLKSHALFALAMALGIIRASLGPIVMPPALMAPFIRTRAVLVSRCSDLFGEQAPLLQAMLWGHKSSIPDDVYSSYRSSGIAHVLALSGLHISFVAEVVDYITRHARPKVKFYIAAAVSFTYCAIAAFPASLIRASIMYLCRLYAHVLGKRYDLASGISLSALIILLLDPSSLTDVGFQLSFAAVATIAMLMPSISDRLSSLPQSISSLLSVSICGTLGTIPLSIYYFGSVPLFGLFANVLIMPVVPLSFISALIVCVAGVFLPGAASFLAPVPILFTGAMSAAAEMVASLPFAILGASITPLCCALIYLSYFSISDYPLISRRYKLYSFAVLMLSAGICCYLG